jgi:predicted PolB exonuclease-like 3'-5' exonuclease
MPLVIDIETVPLADSLTASYPTADRTPPANYKSEETIAKWREQDRVKWENDRVSQCSLNARLGRVLCLGTSEGVFTAVEEADEPVVLQEFWNRVLRHDGQVVTWNGGWDLRFLIVRSLYHDIEPSVSGETVSRWFRKYTTEPHFDCKAVLLNWDVRIAGEGLDQWAKFLGLPGKTEGLSGADVYPLYLAGHLDEIADYCAADVAATQAIYERIQPIFGSSLATL